MYSDRILDGTNCARVQDEAQVWIKVMDELAGVVPEIDQPQQDRASCLIAEARERLFQCTSKKLNPLSPEIKRARKLLKSVLAFFPEWIEFIECVFFGAFAVGGLEFIVSELEAMTPKQLSHPAAKRLQRDLESTANKLMGKLDKLERQLEKDSADLE